MGNSQSHSLPERVVYDIVDETDFTKQQVLRLYDRFQRLDKNETGYLTREDFLRIPELAINPLAERIIDMFLIDLNQQPSIINSNPVEDEDDEDESSNNNNSMNSDLDIRASKTTIEQINFPEFCKMLSNFNGKSKRLSHEQKSDAENSGGSDGTSSKDKKLRFLFKLYDSNNDDQISKEELLSLLRLMVGTNISSQQLDLIAQRTIAETDEDNDGKLNFKEFRKGLENVDIEMKMTVRFNE